MSPAAAPPPPGATLAAYAALIAGLARWIDARLADENADQALIAERAAECLRALAVEMTAAIR